MTQDVSPETQKDPQYSEIAKIGPRPSVKEQKAVSGYQSWLYELKRRLDEGTLTYEEFSELVAKKMFARDKLIEKRKEHAKALEFQVKNDKLVDLESEDAFNDRMDEMIGKRENFGLLLIDIDHFGDINTEYGHLGGNLAIIRTADRLYNTVRGNTNPERTKDNIYRLHGDELAALIPGLTPDDEGKRNLKEIAERIRKSMEDPIRLRKKGKSVSQKITLSIGGGIFAGGKPEEFKDLIDKNALYQAKADGRNRSFILNYDTPKKPLQSTKK